MTIELTLENERIIEHVIHSGAYQDAQDVVSDALEALADVAIAKAQKHEPRVSLEEVSAERRAAAIERLKTFGKTHGLSLGGITLRQVRDEARP